MRLHSFKVHNNLILCYRNISESQINYWEYTRNPTIERSQSDILFTSQVRSLSSYPSSRSLSSVFSRPVGELDLVKKVCDMLTEGHWDIPNVLLSGLTPFQLVQIMKCLANPIEALRFFKFVSTQWYPRHFTQSCCRVTHVLVRERAWNLAQDVLHYLVERVSASAIFESLRITFSGCNGNPAAFDFLFRACVRAKMIPDAIDVYYQMRNLGLRPSIHSLNILLNVLIQLNKPQMILEVFRDLLVNNIPPNVRTFNIIIHAFCKKGELQKGIELMKEMGKHGCEPNVYSYNTVIHALCKMGKLQEALDLFSIMFDRWCSPNSSTYNTLIDGACKAGKMGEGNRIYNEMLEKYILPDKITFNTLISGHCKVGEVDRANLLLIKMLQKCLVPDNFTFNTLIAGNCKLGNEEEGNRLLDEMMKRNLLPDV